MIELQCLITWAAKLPAFRFRTSFWQGQNGFVAGPLRFVPWPADEILFTNPRVRSRYLALPGAESVTSTGLMRRRAAI